MKRKDKSNLSALELVLLNVIVCSSEIPNSLYRQVRAWVDISICQATGGRCETNKWTALNLICRMHSQFRNMKFYRCRQIKSNYLSAQQQSDATFKWKQWKYHEPFRCSIEGHRIISLFTPDIEPKHSNASLPFLCLVLARISIEFGEMRHFETI